MSIISTQGFRAKMPVWLRELLTGHNDGVVINRLEEGMIPGAVQNVASGAASAVIHATLPKYCRVVCVDANVYYVIGETPVAANTDTVLPQGVVEKILVPAGEKIAVLGGTLNITTMV